MPRYDYQCSECNHIQEETHSMSGPVDKDDIICGECKSLKMVKIMSAPTIRFEGDGWQTNDVRNK
jgi:putative FmdB family regulatory protein